ncbi:MAG: hypothetical protein ACE5L7_09670, partial [Candidatus Aminicenantales bacterium]
SGQLARQPANFPHRVLGGEKLRFPPSNARQKGSLPPLLGLRPATKGAYPLGTPDGFAAQIHQNSLIPRLALLFEEPCPLASGWLPHQQT